MSWSERTQPIVAIATASGRGAVGIVRVSGKGLLALMQALLGRELPPRQAVYGPFKDGRGEAIDHGLALYFPGPHSYTGEDVLELQGHGGPVVMQLLLARCLEAAAEPDPSTQLPRLAGLRLAEPGEFTQRAFLNDKIDLAQAEAIADLIDASTEAAARSASRSLGGAFSREIEDLRDRMVNLRMLVEATLDFPEEEIDFLEKADARGKLDRIAAQLETVLGHAKQGALLREGLQVVLAGQPNAGKSSLLNALAGAELAIVTPIAGTTRDKVSETIQIEGVPLHVIDTAGLRADHEASDEVERIGMARSWEAIEAADAVLFLHDLTRVSDPVYAQADADIAQRLPPQVPVVHVYNKMDAQPSAPGQGGDQAVWLSAKTGAGLNTLRETLLRLAGWQAAQEGVFIARQRHVQSLRLAREHVHMAQAHAALADGALDLMAEELRLAHNALGTITGAFTSDDLLGEIFTRFCIGK
ncbi:MAG: tRNA uridine-5-carboxymethylaminomethyl(34) synthesis GTPase MnmE [Acidobacteriota bacterium]